LRPKKIMVARSVVFGFRIPCLHLPTSPLALAIHSSYYFYALFCPVFSPKHWSLGATGWPTTLDHRPICTASVYHVARAQDEDCQDKTVGALSLRRAQLHDSGPVLRTRWSHNI
jgi:hypothetical protein